MRELARIKVCFDKQQRMMASSTEVGHLKEQQDRIIKLAFGLPPLIETRDWKEGTKKVSSKWEWKPSLNHSFSSWKRKVESKENNRKSKENNRN